MPAALETPPAPPAATPPPVAQPPSPPIQSSAPSSTGDPFADLDAKLTERFGEPSVKEGKKPDAPAKHDAPKEPDKPKGDAKPDAPKPPDKPAAIQGGPKELRAELERVKGEHKTAQERVAEYERKLAEAEAKGKDTTALAEKLAQAEKARQELQAELRAAKREVSPEFKEKFEKPFDLSAAYAKRDIEQLTVSEGTEEEGNLTQRAATWDDFIGLYRLPKGKAIAEARKMFGQDQVGVVIAHLTELQKLDYQKGQALEQEKASWETRDKEAAARSAQEREAASEIWRAVNEDLKSKRPEWFAEDPADEEGNKLLAEGRKLADAVFHGRQAMTLQQRVVMDAQVYNRLAAFPRMVHRIESLKNENKELQTKIAEFETSKPGPTRKPGGTDAITDPTMEGDLASALKRAVQT